MGYMAQSNPHALLATKLAPPRQVGWQVPRERLLSRMLEARRARCMLLVGGAGAGKSSALMAYQLALVPLGFEVAWLSLSPEDDEPALFLDYLVASLAGLDVGQVREAQWLTDMAPERESAECLMVSLIQAINSCGKEVILVIDDLHLISESVLRASALQFLIDHAPPNFHLVLAARHAPPLALGRLQAEGQLVELGPQDLRFTRSETAAYLHKLHGRSDAREVDRLHRLCEGWPAGLQLLAMKRASAGAADSPIHDASSFASYFEHEVLSQLSDTEVGQLVRVAVSARFCMRLAAALLANPDGSAASVDASRLVAKIERENLFLVPLESADHERWFRLHPLLREVLLRRLAALPQAEQQGLHRRAADWFQAQGLVDEAVQHRLDAGEAEAAADLLEACADSLQMRAYRGLAQLLHRLPPEVVQRRIKLRLLAIGLQMRLRQYEAAEASMDALARELPARPSLAHTQLALSRAALCVKRDDTEAAQAIIAATGPLPADADGWMVGSLTNLQSLILLHHGDFEGARAAQEQAPPRLVLGEPLLAGSQGILAGRCLAGLSFALEGHITQAEQLYREVLHGAQTHDGDCRDAVCMATALLGETLYERNDVAGTIALLAPQVDLLERFSLPDTVLRGLLTLARAHRHLGQQLESRAYLDRLEDLAQSQGLDRLYAAALVEQAHAHMRQLDLGAAARLIARLDTLAERHAKRGGSLADIQSLVSGVHIRHALARGEFSLAQAQLTRFTAQCTAQGNWQRVARLKLLLAVQAQASGRQAQAEAWTLEALQLGHRLGLLRTVLDVHPDVALPVQALLAQDKLDPVLRFYAERLLQAQHSATNQAPTTASRKSTTALDEPLTQREAEVLHMLVLALPNKKIARSLGLSIETVKWHLRNVYRKLNVAGRDDAVTRARDLGLAQSLMSPPLAPPPH